MKKLSKKKKIALIIVIVLIILAVIGFITYRIINNKDEVKQVTNVSVVTNSIDDYGYTLEDRDTELYVSKFEELKELLSNEDYDTQTYIELISEMFIIDYFTIDNKISKYDIGGMEFIYSLAYDSFYQKSLDTIYKYINDNSYEDRTQELPVVASIEVTSYEESTYTVDGVSQSAIEVQLEWTYEKDLGYQTEATIKLVAEDIKYAIVYFN